MKKIYISILKTSMILNFLFFVSYEISAQTTTQPDFWKNVQFGGGLQLNIGSGFTNVGISPSVLYNVNEFVSVGTGLQVSYVSATNNYSSLIYGINLTTLFNPIESIQLSVDLEQLRVSTTFDNIAIPKQSFWNTGLWLGAGYRTNNITIGGRYNVLFSKEKSVYSDAFLPFVRVYF
jgi:long-subunit fatty acid transport protein